MFLERKKSFVEKDSVYWILNLHWINLYSFIDNLCTLIITFRFIYINKECRAVSAVLLKTLFKPK